MKPIQLTSFFLLFFLFQLGCPLPSLAAEIHLSAAASMADVVRALIRSFTAAHPEIRLRPNFASSGSLAKQIDQGAPADIYISANPKWMKLLVQQGLIAPETELTLAFNSLVFIGETPLENPTLTGLGELTRIALGSPGNVPAGHYAEQAMQRAGVYDFLKSKNKLVLAKDVRQALLYADRGEVDGAFVYKTDALLATHAKIIFCIPNDFHERIAYPMALTISGAGKKQAKMFFDFMHGPEARPILRRYGFEPNL